MSDSSQRRKPSSAAFPQVSSPSHLTDSAHEDEEDEDEEEGGKEQEDEATTARQMQFPGSTPTNPAMSTQAELADAYNTPQSISFAQSQDRRFPQDQAMPGFLQSRSMSDFGLIDSSSKELSEATLSRPERSMSSECLDPRTYADILSARFSNTSTNAIFFQSMANNDCDDSNSPFDECASPDHHGSDQPSHIISQGMPTPTDSFKSPPPPANIASRRNIPRPAALQAASLRNRTLNLGGFPKTGLEGSKRIDTSSPVSSMRRISSATGSGPGRIQKCTAGPRSPLFFGRNAEALLQYHTRSPIGSGTLTFSGAAPPTPMTPALFDQQNVQEPAVISSCSDDSSGVLDNSIRPTFLQELKEQDDLKTPPTTPGLMNDYNGANLIGGSFQPGFNLPVDQPLLTPFFHSEFPDLSLQSVPSYVDRSDGLPSTPVYAGMGLEQGSFTGSGLHNTQYDWDANESVVSSKSSPGQPRSKLIQFTQNTTPRDYH
ncbi:hypothetical protein F5Y16DRAFT_361303 [Xylariaceae sp. FL0255]|nr:hypothetical protein F5Y16DRAFT_361303 [Xylariaceae sp. FL0255]